MAGLITRQELAPTLRQELDDVRTYIDGANNLQYEAHMQNTSNPHGVTKAQVGLGNVSNALQATKQEFDAFISRRDNPHGVTTAQISAVPTSRQMNTGTGLTGGGTLGANRTLALDLSYTDGRYLGKNAKASDSNLLDGYNHDAFMKHGESYLRMSNDDGIRYKDTTNQPGEMYFVMDGREFRAYSSKNIRYGSGAPSGGVDGDIYIQY